MPIFSVNSPLPSGSRRTLPHSCVRAHSLITKASFTEMHTTRSTPLAKNAGASSLYLGTCVEEQVGVKAPGRENTTTVLPLNMSSVVTFFQSPLSVRVRNVACGTACPSRFGSMSQFLFSRWYGAQSREHAEAGPIHCRHGAHSVALSP